MSNISISEIIQNLNKKRNVTFVKCESRNKQYVEEYSGVITLSNGEQLNMAIDFSVHFPTQLPDIYVNNEEEFYAHVGSDGKLCLFDTSSILIKNSLADQIVIDCFDKALNILNILPGTKVYSTEICREFNSYWATISKFKLYSILNLEDIQYGEYPIVNRDGVNLVAATQEEAETFLHNSFGLKNKAETKGNRCLIVRIRNGSNIIALKNNFRWNTVKNFILNNCTSSIKKQFKKFIRLKVTKNVISILLIFPTTEGDILFGFRLEFNNIRFSTIEKSINCNVANILCERIDYRYLTLRSGAAPLLKSKRVLLLGCGSVGGYIANNLCQTGITSLDILDYDYFKPENVHRHFLGFECIHPFNYQHKSDLMKDTLEGKYPYVDIDSMSFVDRQAESLMVDTTRLNQYDLIISALGEPTINLEISRILIEDEIKIPFLCCFNEPYGIGGHVIVTNIDTNSCLQCLYTDTISNELVAFRGSLAAPGQYFKKNISGCSSSFVPYSCLDSQQTALYAARKAIELLYGEIQNNILLSWIGKADNFLAQGFTLSNAYLAHTGDSVFQIDSFANVHCNICKERHKE